jgi:FMN phosphatase YigB (HAD superfamily)
MAQTLAEFADHLDGRQDLAWPAPPDVKPAKARPHLTRLPEVRAVTWSVYGTLLNLAGGELYLTHPQEYMMDLALDKTLNEFKMWKAMTRKPGQPAAQLRLMYNNALNELQFQPSGAEKHPDIDVAKLWSNIIKKLMSNEYTFNTSFYGSLDDYGRKIAYFFHASLQGTGCYPGASLAIEYVHEVLSAQKGVQGLLADGQCFTGLQLDRGLLEQGYTLSPDSTLPEPWRVFSYEVRGKKPSERLFEEMLTRLKARGLEAKEVLHIGSHLLHDVAPARKLGMKTGLFAGDKASLHASGELLKQPNSRPDVLLTELRQIEEVVG